MSTNLLNKHFAFLPNYCSEIEHWPLPSCKICGNFSRTGCLFDFFSRQVTKIVKREKTRRSTLTISKISMPEDDGNTPWKLWHCVTNSPAPEVHKCAATIRLRKRRRQNRFRWFPIIQPEKPQRWEFSKFSEFSEISRNFPAFPEFFFGYDSGTEFFADLIS